MTRNLQARAQAAATKRQGERMQRIVAALESMPGVSAEASATGVTMSGVGLLRRWLADPALRFAARLS